MHSNEESKKIYCQETFHAEVLVIESSINSEAKTVYQTALMNSIPKHLVERWSHDFDALIGNKVGRQLFEKYLVEVKADECLRFYDAVKSFRMMKSNDRDVFSRAKAIYAEFLKPNAMKEVSLESSVKGAIEEGMINPKPDLYMEAETQIYKMLKNEIFTSFLVSDVYHQFLKSRTD